MAPRLYQGVLARPLRPGEKPEDKIPALKQCLRANTDEEAIVAMMHLHVLKKRAPYPAELRGSPMRGPTPKDRIPALKAYLDVSTDAEALLKLAKRHVPGFKSDRRGGRPARGGKSGVFDFGHEATEALIFEAMNDRLGDRRLSVKECAKWVSETPDHPLSGESSEYIIERYNHQKRSERQFVRELADESAKLKSLLK